MVYAPHMRLQWGGTVYDSTVSGGALEVWSNTLSTSLVGPVEAVANIGEMAARVVTYHSDLGTGINARCRLEYVKWNEIAPNGRYLGDFTNQVTANTPGALGTLMPITNSLKVTLDDGSRNPRKRGGWFIPCFSRGIGTDYRISEGDQSDVHASTTRFLVALNAVPGVSVTVASKIAAQNTVVSRLRVGRVPDVIRGRSNNLRESYLAGAVANAP